MKNKLTVTVVVLLIAAVVWGGSAIMRQEAETPATETVKAAAPPPVSPDAVRIAKDPTDIPAPPAAAGPTKHRIEMSSVELDGHVMDGMSFTYWTFDGTVPGQMIRVREGDTVEIVLTNDPSSAQPHSVDLHSVNGPGGGAEATQVMPGETKSFTFKALNPGLYVYHCATPYIPAHIANGMYGLMLVEPKEGLRPVDREFYVMQGELYTDMRPRSRGHAGFSDQALWDENPNFVVFNGQWQALTGEHAMRANVGETVRIYIGNGGPNLISSFHVIGEIFDVVHKEGASEASTNIQTTLIPAGGAAWVEFTVDVPGTYTLVDHSINRAIGKGAVAQIVVEGPENPEVFSH